jgi:Ras GTPase-activating-like protein IQGAP2/3
LLLLQRKYPDASDFAICSLIGGFFFLRFINPAVVTPQAYMLVDGVPAKHPRRTLTLIAKMLQNLANKPSYAKEAYMMSLNQFLNDLCDVGDFYENLEVGRVPFLCLAERTPLTHLPSACLRRLIARSVPGAL